MESGNDNRPLAYSAWGSGEPVLLVHGNFTSRRWWELVARQQVAELRLIAPDLPGFGDSPSRGGQVSMDRYAEDVLDFAGRIGLEKFWLAGLSLGGLVAQGVVCRAPERVKGVVLAGSPGPRGLKTPEERYAQLAAMVGHPEALLAALAAVTPFVADKDWFRRAALDGARMEPRLYTENARAVERVDYSDCLGRYKGPVMAIRGRLDYLIGNADLEAIRAALPQARAEVWEGSGHSPPTDEPERFAALLAEFVKPASSA